MKYQINHINASPYSWQLLNNEQEKNYGGIKTWKGFAITIIVITVTSFDVWNMWFKCKICIAKKYFETFDLKNFTEIYKDITNSCVSKKLTYINYLRCLKRGVASTVGWKP